MYIGTSGGLHNYIYTYIFTDNKLVNAEEENILRKYEYEIRKFPRRNRLPNISREREEREKEIF